MHEACPMVLLESMCLGKIPLMPRLPFSSELTDGGKYGILRARICKKVLYAKKVIRFSSNSIHEIAQVA